MRPELLAETVRMLARACGTAATDHAGRSALEIACGGGGACALALLAASSDEQLFGPAGRAAKAAQAAMDSEEAGLARRVLAELSSREARLIAQAAAPAPLRARTPRRI